MSEYIKLTSEERLTGEKDMLQSEMAMLKSIKRLRAFEKLRKEELVLQINLKRLVGEALESLSMLDKLLPKTAFRPEVRIASSVPKQPIEVVKEIKEANNLESELEKIRAKLSRLQRS